MRAKRWSRVLVALVVFAHLAGPAVVARAANLSHIECWKIKDNLAKAKYTADQASELGCVIKTPAVMVCQETAKLNVTPSPPGGGPDVNLNEHVFFCYKEKCPKIVPGGTFTDQFGTHVVNPTGKKIATTLLCAPASPSGAFLD